MDVLERQLGQMREAYASGRSRLPEEGPNFDQELQAALECRWRAELSPEEQEVLTRCQRYTAAALRATRQGDEAIARYLFTSIERLLQSPDFAPPGRLLVQSAYEAAAAYLDYRRGAYEEGTARIYRALTLDEILERAYGYTAYHIHRIRLLLNLVRLKRRQGEEREALRMSIALMRYLEHASCALPFPTTWDTACLEEIPRSLKQFLFEQTVSEVAFLLVGNADPPADLLPNLFERQETAAVAGQQLSARAQTWLQAWHALHNTFPARFLELATPLIADGPGSADWLWCALLIDLVGFCCELPYKEAEALLHDVAGDMARWKWSSLPPRWQQLFQKIPTGARV